MLYQNSTTHQILTHIVHLFGEAAVNYKDNEGRSPVYVAFFPETMLCVELCPVLCLPAANKSSAIMSTHIIACLLLYRHRQVSPTAFSFVYLHPHQVDLEHHCCFSHPPFSSYHLPPAGRELWVAEKRPATLTVLLSSGGRPLQAGGGLLQHEGGDPVARFRPGLLGELGGRGHAGAAPARKLRQRD